jgi:hypothetical protein
MIKVLLNSYLEQTPASCYLDSYWCKRVSLSRIYQTLNPIEIHKDTYYRQPKNDGKLFKVYGMFSPVSCGYFHYCSLSPVYGIVFLQIFESAADSLNAYVQDARGWSQLDITNPIQPLSVDLTAGNLPLLTDPLSELRVTLYRQI